MVPIVTISQTCLLLSVFTSFVASFDMPMENFEAAKCEVFMDDVIKTGTSYMDCLEHCKARVNCTAVSFIHVSSVCRVHFQEGTLLDCVGHVHSKKSNWEQYSCSCPAGQQCQTRGPCKISECSVLENPSHETLYGNLYSVGSKVTFSCNPGYIFGRDKQWTCGPDGLLSQLTPVCVEDTTCMDSLVTGPDGVKNDKLTASSYWCQGRLECFITGVPHGLSAMFARLDYTGRYTGAWVARAYDIYQFIQVEFAQTKVISEIIMTGRHGSHSTYVSTFSLAYNVGCSRTFLDYMDDAGSVEVFNGLSGPNDLVTISLPERVVAKCVRIKPQSWVNGIVMRFEVKGCNSSN